VWNLFEFHSCQPLNPEPCNLQPSITAVNREPGIVNRFSIVCGHLRESAVKKVFNRRRTPTDAGRRVRPQSSSDIKWFFAFFNLFPLCREP
jgi:hypothetical protein